MKYNGYTNYDTWKVCLNIDNVESVYKSVQETFNKRVDWQKPESAGRLSFITMILVREHEKDFVDKIEWKMVNWDEVATVLTESTENPHALEALLTQDLNQE
ncbi:MAG: hypothetical protein HN624_03015 [Flavobacteriaceae bacterium]|nr:hypothetical protein [Flavobacteriaceae bacterium]